MLKKELKYKDHDGNDRERTIWFHLGKAELMRVGVDNSVLQRMHTAAKTGDRVKILWEVENVVRMAYGVRPEGTDGFRKSDELTQEFIESPAYDEFLMDVLGDEKRFYAFIEAVFPKEVVENMTSKLGQHTSIDELIAENDKKLDIFAEPPNPNSDKGTAVEDPRPAWVREDRKPTKKELMEMPREEMFEAFRQHPGLSTD